MLSGFHSNNYLPFIECLPCGMASTYLLQSLPCGSSAIFWLTLNLKTRYVNRVKDQFQKGDTKGAQLLPLRGLSWSIILKRSGTFYKSPPCPSTPKKRIRYSKLLYIKHLEEGIKWGVTTLQNLGWKTQPLEYSCYRSRNLVNQSNEWNSIEIPEIFSNISTHWLIWSNTVMRRRGIINKSC